MTYHDYRLFRQWDAGDSPGTFEQLGRDVRTAYVEAVSGSLGFQRYRLRYELRSLWGEITKAVYRPIDRPLTDRQ